MVHCLVGQDLDLVCNRICVCSLDVMTIRYEDHDF